MYFNALADIIGTTTLALRDFNLKMKETWDILERVSKEM